MFAKIFSQIFDSSIVENPELRFTLMDLLVLADMDGVVDMTHEAIARRTNRPIDVIRKTISELEGPDPRSRTPDHDGRRLQRLDDHRDWGWIIVNYAKFRETASESERREKTRIRVARFKEKLKERHKGNAPVTHGNAPVTQKKEAEAEAEAEEKVFKKRIVRPSLDEVKLCCAKTGLRETDAVWFWNKCEGNGWTNGGKPIKSWQHTIAAWKAADYMPSQKKQPAVSQPKQMGWIPDATWDSTKGLA
jgi:hypothetical protein